MNTVEVLELPACSFCGKPAKYDFKTIYGPWAYGCQEHYEMTQAYPSLGTGMGQRLVMMEQQ